MSSPLRLGFVSARWSSRDADGRVWSEAGVVRLLDVFRAHFAELHVAMSLSPERLQLHDHVLELPPGRYHPLPWLPSVVGGIRKGPQARAVIREVEARCDALIVQLPFAAPTALLRARKPRAYHVCADIVEIVRTSPHYQGWRKVPARGLAHAIDQLEARLIARDDSRLIANGFELFERFGGADKGTGLVSATLLDREVLSVPRTRPTGGPFRMLFVGYLRHEKGVGTLLEACERLLKNSTRPLELAVVGASHSEDRGVTQALKSGLDALSSRMSVSFLGHKAFGPDLFRCFADADVLVLPSLSEGTPRVLVEARAFGCPVVATRVGGIPTSVDDGVDGVLVPPGDATALASALEVLVRDEARRLELAEAGVKRARRHTVEAMAAQMIAEVERAAGG